jgi:hypothetical protein
LLFQAPFPLLTTNSTSAVDADVAAEQWTTVYVPFDTFRYVRGPRMIPDGPSLSTTGGLYQIGMTMSKFAFGVNTTEMENFRDGFFELQIQEIGLYTAQRDTLLSDMTVVAPKVVSKIEAKRRRPLVIKMLVPVVKVFFSEQR